MAHKDDLVEQARELGIADADDMKVTELEEAIAERTPAELGPVIPEGESAPPPPKPSGQRATGVQPVERDDIPEAGR
jgi:hypothetical protein